jgi:ABC-2 type transport system permease protein
VKKVENMNKTLLIFRHEFLTTLRRTGFIILTLGVPLVGLLGVVVYERIAAPSTPTAVTQTRVGFVDEAGGFNQSTSQGAIALVPYATSAEATTALVNGDVPDFIVIPPDYIATGVVQFYSLQKQLVPPSDVSAAIQSFLVSNMLSGRVPPATADRIQAPLNLVTTTLTPTGAPAPEQGGLGSFIVPYIFCFLLLFAIIFSSIYVLQGLSDEKENRLMEILVSSVSTTQLLFGKVLGIGAAGLVQVAVWAISVPLLLSLASNTIGGSISSIQAPVSLLAIGVVYFVLGYLFFAVIQATAGALSPTAREGQQLTSVFGIFLVAPLWATSLLVLYPDNPIWVILTIFPASAPVVTMARLGLTGVPAWQLAASMAVLAISVIGGLWLAAKVFRTYLLMYGKRPRLGEIVRTLRSG